MVYTFSSTFLFFHFSISKLMLQFFFSTFQPFLFLTHSLPSFPPLPQLPPPSFFSPFSLLSSSLRSFLQSILSCLKFQQPFSLMCNVIRRLFPTHCVLCNVRMSVIQTLSIFLTCFHTQTYI